MKIAVWDTVVESWKLAIQEVRLEPIKPLMFAVATIVLNGLVFLTLLHQQVAIGGIASFGNGLLVLFLQYFYLNEFADGRLPGAYRDGANFLRMIGAMLVFMLGLMLAMVVLVAIAALILRVVGAPAFAPMLAIFPSAILSLFITLRLFPKITARAVGISISWQESWRLTRGNSWRLLGITVLSALPLWIGSVIIGLLTKLLPFALLLQGIVSVMSLILISSAAILILQAITGSPRAGSPAIGAELAGGPAKARI